MRARQGENRIAAAWSWVKWARSRSAKCLPEDQSELGRCLAHERICRVWFGRLRAAAVHHGDGRGGQH